MKTLTIMLAGMLAMPTMAQVDLGSICDSVDPNDPNYDYSGDFDPWRDADDFCRLAYKQPFKARRHLDKMIVDTRARLNAKRYYTSQQFWGEKPETVNLVKGGWVSLFDVFRLQTSPNCLSIYWQGPDLEKKRHMSFMVELCHHIRPYSGEINTYRGRTWTRTVSLKHKSVHASARQGPMWNFNIHRKSNEYPAIVSSPKHLKNVLESYLECLNTEMPYGRGNKFGDYMHGYSDPFTWFVDDDFNIVEVKYNKTPDRKIACKG